MDQNSTFERRERTPRARWFVAVAAVIAAVALLGGTGPSASTVPMSQSTVITPPPTFRGDGSREGPLLPFGVPSTTTASDLVASITLFHKGAYRLYADGRLLWYDETRDDSVFPWTEQRLSPDGIERVRSRFLASGLFDAAPPSSDAPTCQGWFEMCVRESDRWLVEATDPPPGGPLPYGNPRPEAVQLFSDLGELDATLASTDWADPQPERFTPGRVATCVRMFVTRKGGNAVHVPKLDLPALLQQFPARAAALLAVREPSTALATSLAPLLDPPPAENGCFDLSLDEARTLADALLSPSGGGTHAYWGIAMKLGRRADPLRPGATGREVAYLSFRDLLPEGAPSAYFGG